LRDDSCGDLFIGKGRLRLNVHIAGVPVQTREATLEEWVVVDELRKHIENLEQRIPLHTGRIGYVRLRKTMPGVGEILGATNWLEVGGVERFPSAAHLWPAMPAWCRRCMPWILKQKQPYREPVPFAASSSRHGQARRSFSPL